MAASRSANNMYIGQPFGVGRELLYCTVYILTHSRTPQAFAQACLHNPPTFTYDNLLQLLIHTRKMQPSYQIFSEQLSSEIDFTLLQLACDSLVGKGSLGSTFRACQCLLFAGHSPQLQEAILAERMKADERSRPDEEVGADRTHEFILSLFYQRLALIGSFRHDLQCSRPITIHSTVHRPQELSSQYYRTREFVYE